MATKRFITPFADTGIKSPISDVPAGTDVNYETGYTPEYALDPETNTDARFVEIANENQLLNDITGNTKLWQENVYPDFITSASNGGAAFEYKKGDVALYNGVNYESLEDGNTSLPTTIKWAVHKPTSLIKGILIAQGYSGNYGFFKNGFDYTSAADLGVSSDNKFYRYVGSESYPVSIDADTDPEEADFEQVTFSQSAGSGIYAYTAPSFSGNYFTVPAGISEAFVTVNGRGLSPNDVSIDEISGSVTGITLGVDIGGSDEVVIRAAFTDSEAEGKTDFNDADEIKNHSSIGVQEGSVITTREFYEGLGYGGAAYDVLSESDMTTAGYLASGLGYTHFEIGESSLYACLRFNKAIVLDKIGGKKSDPTFDNKPIHDAAVGLTDVVYLTGDYYAENIIFPIKELTYRGIGNGYCKFRALDTGNQDNGYFAAPKTWIDNSSSCNPPITTDSVGFDGGSRTYALVVHWYFGNHENLFVDNGSTNAVLMTALNRDGSSISSTMVNNRFRNTWIEGGAVVGFQVTEDAKTTDWELVGGYIFNDGSITGATNSINIAVATCAGATISGMHCYAAQRNLSIAKWSTGTRVFGNYFENVVQVRQGLNDTFPLIFGPANTVNGDLELILGVECGPIKSVDNFYRGLLQHKYFGDKKVYSTGDNFTEAAPFRFDSYNAGNVASFNILHAVIGNESVSGVLSPATTTAHASLRNDFEEPLQLSTDTLVTLDFKHSTTGASVSVIPAGDEVRSLIPFDGSDLSSQDDVFMATVKGLPIGVSQSVYFDQAVHNKWKIKLVNSTSSDITITASTAIVTKFN